MWAKVSTEVQMIHRAALITACLLVLAAAPASAFDLNLAVGADFNGDFDIGNISLSSDTGFLLGLEIAFKIPVVELGAGVEYGFPRDAKAVDVEAKYLNFYGIGRMFFGPAYIAARLGYSDYSVNRTDGGGFGGGASWGLGGGVELFGKLKFELLFNNLGGDLSYQSWTIRALYTF